MKAIGVFAVACAFVLCAAASAATYYVDSRSGDDRKSGTSPRSAWRSLAAVNGRTFEPGDRILFHAGGEWTGELRPRGSGTSGKPIVVGRYAEGPKPVIRGNGAVAAIHLRNQEHWEISNIEITNDAPDEGLRRGVLVEGEQFAGPLQHIYLRGLDVHHVRGRLGPDMVSKTTGGIGFEVRGTGSATRFDDILVEDCIIRDLDSTGIYTFSESSPHPRHARWEQERSTNVRIRRNRLSGIGKNAIVVRSALAPVIEHNVIERAAARLHGNAAYVFGCKDAVIQLNEVFGTRLDRIEGAAFDSDYNSEGTIIQYNYSHDNGGGLVNLCCNPASKPPGGYNDGTVVRYNISQNDVYRVFAFDGPVTNAHIYNNTVYVGRHLAPKIVEFDLFGKAPGYARGTSFRNNIIYNLGGGTYDWGQSRDNAFEYNCFFGNHPAGEPEDPHKLVADPLFVAPGTGSLGRASVAGYKLRPDSACLGSGVRIPQNGGRDWWGNPLRNGRPDRGAFEHP